MTEWSESPPTRLGWYWVFNPHMGTVYMARIHAVDGILYEMIGDRWVHAKWGPFRSHWMGPVQPPPPPE